VVGWSPSSRGRSPRPRPRGEGKPAAARAIRCNSPPSRRNKVPPRARVRRCGAQVAAPSLGHGGCFCESRKVEPHIRVMLLAGLCLARERRTGDSAPVQHGSTAHSRECGNLWNLFCDPHLRPRVCRDERSRVSQKSCRREAGGRIMASYGPELIQTMRAVLDEVMTKIPVDQVTPGLKAHMAQIILKAAAEGQTSYDALLASASDQIQTILSMLT